MANHTWNSEFSENPNTVNSDVERFYSPHTKESAESLLAIRSANCWENGFKPFLPSVEICGLERDKAEPKKRSLPEFRQTLSSTDETWKSKVTFEKNRETGISFTLNDKEIESWKLGPGSLEPLLHPDTKPDREGLWQRRTDVYNAVTNSEMTADEKLEFFTDMARLEHRARSGDMGRDLPKVRLELAETYEHMRRLFDDSPSPVSAAHRVVLARQLAHQLADTFDIDQGMASDACRISTVECRLSVTRPSVVSRIIADAALSGEVMFGEKDIRTIKLDNQSLKPASDLCMAFPKVQEERTYVSQIFQLALMNLIGTDPVFCKEHIHYTNLARPEGSPQIPEYEKLVFKQNTEGKRQDGKLLKKDNGLEIFGVKNGKSERITQPGKLQEGTNQPLLQACMCQRLLDLVDPDMHKGAVIAHRDLDIYTRQNLSNQPASDIRGLVLFKDSADLEKLVAKAKTDGRLPLIVASRNFDPDPGEKPPVLEPNESNHVITIRDFKPARFSPDGKVIEKAYFVTDDQFGKDYDQRRIPLDKLYKLVSPGK